MRLRVLFSAFAVVALLSVNVHASSEAVSRTAPIRPIPAFAPGGDERDVAQSAAAAAVQLEQARAEFFDGLARADAQRQADAEAAQAEQQRQAERAAARAAIRATTTTTARPDPTPSGGGDAEGAVRAYFGDVFDEAWGSDRNYGVTTCESGHDPSAVGGGANYGLFQINISHRADFEAYTGKPWAAVFDAYTNALYARHVYDNAGGWNRDWSCAWAAYR